uniref:Uncharacterized protein n=1 Tax=Hyaloperonospora arabidopsidis (strain Emoy2) TaxID=559515 RepID=M4C1H0_HYAAE
MTFDTYSPPQDNSSFTIKAVYNADMRLQNIRILWMLIQCTSTATKTTIINDPKLASSPLSSFLMGKQVNIPEPEAPHVDPK